MAEESQLLNKIERAHDSRPVRDMKRQSTNVGKGLSYFVEAIARNVNEHNGHNTDLLN